MVESVVESKSAFGMVANTVIVKLKPEAIEPSMKRRRTEDTVTEDLEGFGTLITLDINYIIIIDLSKIWIVWNYNVKRKKTRE